MRIFLNLTIFILWSQILGNLANEDQEASIVYNDGDIKALNDVEGNFDIKEEENVLVLTRENFNHVINTRKFVLVEFYAPWCAHCKDLAPDYSIAAKILKMSNLTVGKIDATVEVSLAQEYGVQSFPTIFLFENGVKTEEYNGERSADGIVTYMETRADPNWKPPPTKVVELTTETFSKYLENVPVALVLFYADYCQHCQKIKPEFISAAKIMFDYGVPLVQIEGMKNKEIADEFKVRAWPTFFVFRNGRAFEYKGGRDSKGIVTYMKEQLQSPTYECKTVKEIQNRIDRYLPTVIGLFKSEKSPFYREFFVVANYLRGEPLRFIHSFKKTGRENFNISLDGEGIIVKKPTVFISDYEKSEARLLDPNKDGDEIAEFIRLNYRPLVGQRTKQNQVLFYSVRPLIVVYYDAIFTHQFQVASEIIRKKVIEVAKDFPKITFAVANEEDFPEELEAVKLLDSGVDVNVVWYDKSRVKFTMDPTDDFSSADLRNFIQQIEDQRLKPVWRSQPIPKEQKGSVFIAVADNFEEKLFKGKDKDVVFYIYAPWCGHCKEFDKTFKNLAKKMSSKKLVFSKMDGVANDLPPGLEVKGYPTIFFLKARSKHEPILYEGDRNPAHFKAFVSQHLTDFSLTEEEEKAKRMEEKEKKLEEIKKSEAEKSDKSQNEHLEKTEL